MTLAPNICTNYNQGSQTSAGRDAQTSGQRDQEKGPPDMDDGNSPVNPPRKAISRRVRFEVLRRDGHTCYYCGAKAPDVPLTVDHVIPTVLGGTDDPTNLVTACRDCNSGKTSTSPAEHVVADVDALAARYAAAIERATELRRAKANGEEAFLREFYDRALAIWKWDDWLTHGWERSITIFAENGLTVSELINYLYVTLAAPNLNLKHMFRYFCGCCWNEIRDRQALALELLSEAPDGP